MAEAIGEVLLPAFGVALSPFPIVAVILILTSGRSRAKGIAFALGWMLGLAAMVGVLLLIAGWVGIEPSKDGPSTMASIVRLALGAGLLALAASKWRSRPRLGDEAKVPGWMESIQSANWLNALVIGLGLSGLNPKNMMFNLSAGTAIASATSDPREEAVAWLIYIVLASLAVLGPVGWSLVAPDAAASRLNQPRQWLIDNSTALVAVTVLLIGVSQIGKAIAGLG